MYKNCNLFKCQRQHSELHIENSKNKKKVILLNNTVTLVDVLLGNITFEQPSFRLRLNSIISHTF